MPEIKELPGQLGLFDAPDSQGGWPAEGVEGGCSSRGGDPGLGAVPSDSVQGGWGQSGGEEGRTQTPAGAGGFDLAPERLEPSLMFTITALRQQIQLGEEAKLALGAILIAATQYHNLREGKDGIDLDTGCITRGAAA